MVIQGHSRYYFGVDEKPLRDYIFTYDFACESSEDIVSKRSEHRHFRRPHSHMTPPLQRIPANIVTLPCYKLGSMDYNFATSSMDLSSFNFLVSSEIHRPTCNVTERTMAVQASR